MKVSVENINPVKKSVQIEIPQEAVSQAYRHALEHLQSEAHWPGFRPGKVPVGLLLKKYERALHDEVVRELVPEYYQKAIRDLGLSVVDTPQIQKIDFKKDAPLSFTALVDVLPEIQLADYAGLTLPPYDVPVTKNDIEKGLEILQERQGYLENYPDDHSITLSDYVIIDFAGEVDGKPLPGGIQKGYSVCIGSKAIRPEIEEALLGKKKGDTFFVDTAIPADDPEKSLQNKRARFKIEVHEVKVKRLPAPDDEFAKDLGAASILELKESVKTALIAERKAEGKRHQKEHLMKKLVDLHPIEIPEPLVTRELEALWKETGISETPDLETYKAWQKIAQNRVRKNLILDAISDREKIEVLETELEDALQGITQSRGIPLAQGKREIMQHPHALTGLKTMIRQGKALERVYTLAKVEAIKEEVTC